ncbi:MAG TPA: hypothetical protein VFR97_12375 [Capillimicrobium sp.]|nr:hypothetical protein [Capillimicrobium sp.]
MSAVVGATTLVRAVAGPLQRGPRAPDAVLEARDPDAIRERLPRQWLLSSLWHRAEVRGLAHVPEQGPVLLVGNRSGGQRSPDTGVLTLAFSTFFGVERPFYELDDPGTAAEALAAGAAVLHYPGGSHEAHRPSWESARVDLAGRRAFVRLALDAGVPIVPVVAIGGQETALFLGRGGPVARMLGLPSLPISVGLPTGVNVGGVVPHVPLPSKIVVEVLPRIDLAEEFGPDPDVDVVYAEVVARMQETLDALASERRWPVVG